MSLPVADEPSTNSGQGQAGGQGCLQILTRDVAQRVWTRMHGIS